MCKPPSLCAPAGPVDGPAIFRQVQGCRVAVASQQCRVIDSSDLDLGKLLALSNCRMVLCMVL